MAFKKKKLKTELNINLVPMIDVTSFILLSLAILAMSMKKEASLDNILKLPPVVHAMKQDKSQLQIYVLPAALLPGGYLNPDSTGLVAFMGKSKAPEKCPNCGLALRNDKKEYISGTLLNLNRTPLLQMKVVDEKNEEELRKLSKERPPAYLCSRCNYEIGPYLKLEEIPKELKAKKKEVVDLLVNTEVFTRTQKGEVLSPDAIKALGDSIKNEIPLMIKADDEAFYGRILQVVYMAKDTSCDIKKFAFVTLPEASQEAKKKAAKQ